MEGLHTDKQDVSLGINGDLGSAIMMSHEMTLLALTSVRGLTLW